MSLPPLDRLPLPCPVGMDASSSSSSTEEQKYKDLFPYAPNILCLQDEKPKSKAAARGLFRWMIRFSERNELFRYIFDEKVEYDRFKEAQKEGQEVLMPPKSFHLPVPNDAPSATAANYVATTVQNRLVEIAKYVAQDLGAKLVAGDTPIMRRTGLGFSLTLTEVYPHQDYYNFHQNINPDWIAQFLPEDTDDWCAVTMIYYMTTQPEDAVLPGQNSTLLNMDNLKEEVEDEKRPWLNTRVAFCPFKNGSITVLDGTRWFAVGPNFGSPRGATVFRFILYKPKKYETIMVKEQTAPTHPDQIVKLFQRRLELGDDWINANIREKHKAQKRREPPWPRDEWWRRVEASIRTYASWPAQELGVVSHGESTLLNTWEQSEGGTSMEDALRGLSSAR